MYSKTKAISMIFLTFSSYYQVVSVATIDLFRGHVVGRAKCHLMPYTCCRISDHFLPHILRQIGPVLVRIDQIGAAEIDQLAAHLDRPTIWHRDHGPMFVIRDSQEIVQLQVQMHANWRKFNCR